MPSSAIPLSFMDSRTSAAPLEPVKGSRTDEPRSMTLSIHSKPRGTLIEGSPWKLGEDIWYEIRIEASGYVAIQGGVDEYGVGATSEEAVQDLLSSLVDYRAWLEKHQSKLADKERQALGLLQSILETR